MKQIRTVVKTNADAFVEEVSLCLESGYELKRAICGYDGKPVFYAELEKEITEEEDLDWDSQEVRKNETI